MQYRSPVGFGAVIEDVALVAVAAGAMNFGASHKEFGVGSRLDHP